MKTLTLTPERWTQHCPICGGRLINHKTEYEGEYIPPGATYQNVKPFCVSRITALCENAHALDCIKHEWSTEMGDRYWLREQQPVQTIVGYLTLPRQAYEHLTGTSAPPKPDCPDGRCGLCPGCCDDTLQQEAWRAVGLDAQEELERTYLASAPGVTAEHLDWFREECAKHGLEVRFEKPTVHRPLDLLTDEEIATIGAAAGYRNLFPEPLGSRLWDLGQLAGHEEAERES